MISRAAVIADARVLINDTDASGYRYEDPAMQGFFAHAVAVMMSLRPDLFAVLGNIVCVAGVTQRVPDGQPLMEVYANALGNAVLEVTRETLDQTAPGWRTAAAGHPTNWVRNKRDQSVFMLSPPVTAGYVIEAQWLQAPADYATLSLPSQYATALAFLVGYCAESINDESAAPQRAATLLGLAKDALSVARQEQTKLTDETGGVNGTQKI